MYLKLIKIEYIHIDIESSWHCEEVNFTDVVGIGRNNLIECSR